VVVVVEVVVDVEVVIPDTASKLDAVVAVVEVSG